METMIVAIIFLGRLSRSRRNIVARMTVEIISNLNSIDNCEAFAPLARERK